MTPDNDQLDLTSDALLEEMLKKGEQELFPKFRSHTMRFIDAFNNHQVQTRIRNVFTKLDEKITTIQTSTKVEAFLFSLRDLLDFVKCKFTPIKLLERLQVSGLFALINDERFNFLGEDMSEGERASKLLKLLDQEENEAVNVNQAFEDYVKSWAENQKHLNAKEINIAVFQMRKDKEKADKIVNKEVEFIIDDVRKYFEPLREKLVPVQKARTGLKIGTAATTLVAAGIATVASGGLAFPLLAAAAVPTMALTALGACPKKYRKRSKSGWYDETVNFCTAFLTHHKSDDQFRRFLKKEQLEEDVQHFKECIASWTENFRSITRSPNGFIISKNVAMAEIDRMAKFIYAAVLNRPELLSEHTETVNNLIKSAVETEAAGSDFLPFLSFGQLSIPGANGKREVRLTFVLRANQTQHTLDRTLIELSKMFDNIKKTATETENGSNLFHIDIDVDENLAFLVARNVAKLADLSIRAVLVGSFGLGGFRHAMNPQFNRIYGKDEDEGGFLSTFFDKPLLRGEEPYFCPNGWRRYAINVGKNAEEFELAYRDWPVAYHGTAGHTSTSILHSGLRASGEGCYLRGCIYLSPSIEYSGHTRYATVWKIRDKYVQMVLQARVKKTLIYDRKPGTLPGAYPNNPKIDPNFANNYQLEWLVKWPPGQTIDALGGILVYGLMLRVTNEHPGHLPQCAWWEQSRKEGFWQFF